MIISTTDYISGRRVSKVIGVVRGNTVRAKHLGKDILASLKRLVGGELTDYTAMIKEARDQSTERMLSEAKELGADAVVNVRYMTAQVVQGAAEILCYGTAVKLEKE